MEDMKMNITILTALRDYLLDGKSNNMDYVEGVLDMFNETKKLMGVKSEKD